MKIIAHISDPHFGTEDRGVLAGLLDELHGRTGPAPSLVAVSGDLTQRARSSQFRAARAFLDRLPCPYIVVPGNHDVPLYNVFSRFANPLGAYRDEITKVLAPTYSDDTLAVAGIATAHGMTIKDGKVSREQIDLAVDFLDDYPAHWKIVVAHHPFFGPDVAEDDLVDAAGTGLAAFRLAGVHMILSGHLHISFTGESAMRDEDHRIISVHAGTCISKRTRGEPNNYNRICFEGDEVTIVVRTWDGSQFVDADSKTYRRPTLRSATQEIRKVH